MAVSTTNHLLSAAVLLSILAAAAASGPTHCEPGLAIPHNPLLSCRWYVAGQACGVGPSPPTPAMKERCCRALADIVEYCRCGALRILMDGVVTSEGFHEGRYLQDLPRCPRQAQRMFAATLVAPAECNLQTLHGGPFCLSLGEQTVPSISAK